ncbi:Structural maintenance of chromosomes protein 5, partial [Coemansia sp. RSA 2681]
YIADGTRYATARGRYGSHAATVTTARIAPHARLLGSGGAESDDVRATRARLGAEIDALRDALAAGEAQMKRLARREQAARDAHRAAEEQDAALARARRARADALERWERQRVHVDSKRAQLAVVLASTPSASVVDTARTARALRANACDRAACLADAARHATAAASAVHALARGGLAGVGAARALADARRELSVLRDAAADAQAAFERASDAFARAKAAARAALEETRAATDGMTEAERQAVRDEQETRRLNGDSALESSAALETELATCRQRLSMAAASGVSAAAIAQLAERQARLAAMAAQAQQIDAELLHVRRRKRAAREQWEQPLTDVVARISDKFRAMFDHIECLGEVSLRRAADADDPAGGDEDYDNWGIDIRVAFRKNEALQALDNHRQSGGERAVSTILYLQALQSLVAAPFRVVDEINQGMDERNERLVHSLIVDS